jgi:hypothetical protein
MLGFWANFFYLLPFTKKIDAIEKKIAGELTKRIWHFFARRYNLFCLFDIRYGLFYTKYLHGVFELPLPRQETPQPQDLLNTSKGSRP